MFAAEPSTVRSRTLAGGRWPFIYTPDHPVCPRAMSATLPGLPVSPGTTSGTFPGLPVSPGTTSETFPGLPLSPGTTSETSPGLPLSHRPPPPADFRQAVCTF